MWPLFFSPCVDSIELEDCVDSVTVDQKQMECAFINSPRLLPSSGMFSSWRYNIFFFPFLAQIWFFFIIASSNSRRKIPSINNSSPARLWIGILFSALDNKCKQYVKVALYGRRVSSFRRLIFSFSLSFFLVAAVVNIPLGCIGQPELTVLTV